MFGRILLAAVAAPLVVAMPTIEDPKFIAEAESALQADCGRNCVTAFRHMMAWAKQSVNPGPEGKVMMSDALNELMADAKKEGSELVQKLNAYTQSSFLQQGAVTAMEVAAEKCNFARIGATATYQALNLAVHVVSVVGSLLCGCFAAGPAAICALGGAPWCVFFDNVFRQAAEQSNSAWEAVKGTTKTCAMHGDPRIAS
jgi:hypothetical protein